MKREADSDKGEERNGKRREIPHIRRPTLSQERSGKKKSACSVRNDGGREARKSRPAAFGPVTASGMQQPQMTEGEGRGQIEIKPRRAFSAEDRNGWRG